MSTRWKKDELWWANALGGWRNPSQGIPFPDVEGEHFLAEHKSKIFKTIPAFLRKAISQYDFNDRFSDGRLNLILLTFSFGRGIAKRRFALIEVGSRGIDPGELRELLSARHE